jgi:TatD DNase family protein
MAWEKTSALPGKYKRIKTALGLHPQLAGKRESELSLFESLIQQTRYVGEVGLDGTPEFKPSFKVQEKVFNSILGLCTQHGGKIISIHSRGASEEVIQCLGSHKDYGVAVLHWFSGSFKELEMAIDIGCWFSVGPAMLASAKGRKLLAKMPRNRVLTETDGPFTNWNGSRLMPWDVQVAVDLIAEIWNITSHETQGIITENFKNILQLNSPNAHG